jgi:dihydroneopterin aldolase
MEWPKAASSDFKKSDMHISEYNIKLNNIHIYAHHGVMPQEREVGAWFIIDIKLTMNDCSCADNDSIVQTVSYADIYDIICTEMKEPSNLLEHVCKRISCSLYSAFTQIEQIEITLCKETPPMGGDRLKAAVTIKSRR